MSHGSNGNGRMVRLPKSRLALEVPQKPSEDLMEVLRMIEDGEEAPQGKRRTMAAPVPRVRPDGNAKPVLRQLSAQATPPQNAEPAPPAFVNPTGGGIRGQDEFGSGAYGASRDGGSRPHNGLDIEVPGGEGDILSPINGEVTKLGWTYNGDQRYRYVEITDPQTGQRVRLHYVEPGVEVGDQVQSGSVIGSYRSLDPRYPGITPHVHVEVIEDGVKVDPGSYFGFE